MLNSERENIALAIKILNKEVSFRSEADECDLTVGAIQGRFFSALSKAYGYAMHVSNPVTNYKELPLCTDIKPARDNKDDYLYYLDMLYKISKNANEIDLTTSIWQLDLKMYEILDLEYRSINIVADFSFFHKHERPYIAMQKKLKDKIAAYMVDCEIRFQMYKQMPDMDKHIRHCGIALNSDDLNFLTKPKSKKEKPILSLRELLSLSIDEFKLRKGMTQAKLKRFESVLSLYGCSFLEE